jgi:hypothetical protein
MEAYLLKGKEKAKKQLSKMLNQNYKTISYGR